MGSLRITPPLLMATAGALAIIIAAVLAGWLAIDRLGTPAARQSTANAEILAAAFAVARHSGALASHAAIPTSLADTPDTLSMRSAATNDAAAALTAQLDILDHAAAANPDRSAAIRTHADALVANSQRIEAGRSDLLRLLTDGRDNYRKFSYDYHRGLNTALVTSLDDQLYDMMTWRVEAGQSANPADNPVSRAAVLRHQHTFELLAAVRVVIGKLLEASVLSHPFQVVLVQEEYEAAAQRMQSSLEYLESATDPPLPPAISRLAREILAAGSGDNNLFQALERRLQLAAAEQQQIADNRQILTALLHETDALAAETQLRADAHANATMQTAATARIILIIIGAIGIIGTLAAAAYFAARPARE